MTVKIGWFTHHITKDAKTRQIASDGLFSGVYAGGAEMSDEAYRDFAPDHVQVQLFTPASFNPVERRKFDRVIVTGTDQFDDHQLDALAGMVDVVLLHHAQSRSQSRKDLIEAAETLIVHTPAHEALESEWVTPKRVKRILSWFDTTQIPARKETIRGAIWAARRHPLKGELAARYWAAENKLPFKALSDVPRSVVLDHLAAYEYFVHLPMAFESECRTAMEAVLAGCKMELNDNVGLTSVEDWQNPDHLRALINKAPEQLWDVIL